MCVRLRLRTDEGKRLLLFFFQAATAAEVLFLRGLSLDPCCYSVCLPGLCVTVVMVTWCVCYSLGLFLLKSKTRHSRGLPLPLCRVRVLVACSVRERPWAQVQQSEIKNHVKESLDANDAFRRTAEKEVALRGMRDSW